MDNLDRDELVRGAALFENEWRALCVERGETRYVEMMDVVRRCYGRLFIPSEVLFVWNRNEWIPSSDSDHYGTWAPVVSQVASE